MKITPTLKGNDTSQSYCVTRFKKIQIFLLMWF